MEIPRDFIFAGGKDDFSVGEKMGHTPEEKRGIKMKRFLSILLAILMLAVMLPVTAMAAGDPTLGSDKVWKNVDSTNVQALLDGEYGPIDNTTIELSAGDYSKIEFGRATAHKDSNTKYYLGGNESSVDAIKQDIKDHPNGGAGKREYVRYMSNVTLKAADNAEVNIKGLVAFGGQVNSNKWYSRDFVADRDMEAAVNNNISYWIGQNWSNITFKGLTFTGGVNIEAYGNKDTLINNVKFDNCKFSIADNPSDTYCIRLNVDGNLAKANNIVVEKCEFTNGNTAVLTDGMPNVTVTDSSFSGLVRHAINPMMNYLPNAPGYGKITVTGNTFKNMSTNAEKGTILRMGDVGAGAVLTIKNNTATEGITLAYSVKVNSLADSGITYDISGNNWGENLKFSEEFENVVDKPIPEPSGPIIIYPPTGDTPKTDDQKNPTTGANDFVGIAAAAAVVALLGSAVILRKK